MFAKLAFWRRPVKDATTPKIALVIAAHNEEMVLSLTLASAIVAGQSPNDIYVIDDGSMDRTRQEAQKYLPMDNVVSVWQKGKAMAIATIVERRQLTERYDWIHLSDADGFFEEGYFETLRQKINPKYASATTYLKSLPGTSTSEYRTVEYTWAMEVLRPAQSFLQLITIIPGPAAIFRSDVFKKLDFTGGSLTEDFDVSMQIRRNRWGDVQFIKEATVGTQDPKNFDDYRNQIRRWYRGLFQVTRMHGLGFGMQREDFYFLYQFVQIVSIASLYFILAPLMAVLQGSFEFLALLFLTDIGIFLAVVLLMGLLAGRPGVFFYGARFYMMRWISVFTFLRAFFDVMVLNKYPTGRNAWSTQGRRYQTTTVSSGHV